MKAAVDLTIIKTEKVDIELFPSPGERRVPSAPRSAQPRPLLPAEVWPRGKGLTAAEGVVTELVGGFLGVSCAREHGAHPQVAAQRRRPGSARCRRRIDFPSAFMTFHPPPSLKIHPAALPASFPHASGILAGM